MRLKGRIRLSFTNVLATIALFAALCGTSYAALRITGKNIKNNTVASKDIRDRTLARKDFIKGLLTSAAATPLNSAAFEASRDDGPSGIGPSGDFTPVATLGGIQPGAYWIMAKTDLRSNQSDRGRCRLQAGSAADEANRGLRAGGTPEAINLELSHTFASAGSASLSCRSSEGTWAASDSKILAIRVDSAAGGG
jgi:hypothetical protein